MLGISVYEALRDAIAQSHESHSEDGKMVQLTAPATAENVLKSLRGLH
jgi:xanthine dehydrogenase molybdopterin-binding subunit B